jgi:uncharacterized membrane protein YkvA (DUF1232 family)
MLAAAIVGYAFSPVDLIPDFIPVVGHLDDLILVPLGVIAVRALVPGPVFEECRARAARLESKPTNRVAGIIVVAIWLSLAALAIYWLSR